MHKRTRSAQAWILVVAVQPQPELWLLTSNFEEYPSKLDQSPATWETPIALLPGAKPVAVGGFNPLRPPARINEMGGHRDMILNYLNGSSN